MYYKGKQPFPEYDVTSISWEYNLVLTATGNFLLKENGTNLWCINVNSPFDRNLNKWPRSTGLF